MTNILPWRERLTSNHTFLTDKEWDSVVENIYLSLTQPEYKTNINSTLNDEQTRNKLYLLQQITNSFQDITNASLRSRYMCNYQAILLAYESMNGCKTTFKNVSVGKCCFSGDAVELMQSRIYRIDGSLSQPFVYHERFVTMVKCWTLLGRAMEYTTDVIRKYITENTEKTIEGCRQDPTVQLVKYNMNSAAQYLFLFLFC
jgi:hypothetical protein